LTEHHKEKFSSATHVVVLWLIEGHLLNLVNNINNVYHLIMKKMQNGKYKCFIFLLIFFKEQGEEALAEFEGPI
jgi:hypothetical protein